MVEGTRSLLKDAILSDPTWVLQDPMKQGGSPKLRSGTSVPTPFLCGRALSYLIFSCAVMLTTRGLQLATAATVSWRRRLCSLNKALAASGREDDDRDFTARGPSRFLLRFLKACHSPPSTPPPGSENKTSRTSSGRDRRSEATTLAHLQARSAHQMKSAFGVYLVGSLTALRI